MPAYDPETDEMIREALAESDEELAAASETQSTAELLAETFRGRNRRLAIGGVAANLVLFGLGIFGALRFLHAGDAQETAFWGIVTLFAFGALLSVKVWYWLEMNRLAIGREVKRVELRVARLAEELRTRRSKGSGRD